MSYGNFCCEYAFWQNEKKCYERSLRFGIGDATSINTLICKIEKKLEKIKNRITNEALTKDINTLKKHNKKIENIKQNEKSMCICS